MKDFLRATRKQYWADEKIRIVLDGLRGKYSIAKICKRHGIACWTSGSKITVATIPNEDSTRQQVYFKCYGAHHQSEFS